MLICIYRASGKVYSRKVSSFNFYAQLVEKLLLDVWLWRGEDNLNFPFSAFPPAASANPWNRDLLENCSGSWDNLDRKIRTLYRQLPSLLLFSLTGNPSMHRFFIVLYLGMITIFMKSFSAHFIWYLMYLLKPCPGYLLQALALLTPLHPCLPAPQSPAQQTGTNNGIPN